MEQAYFVEEAAVPFLSREGQRLGILIILPTRTDTLMELSAAEAKQHGEEPIQFFEGCTYEYHLTLIDTATNYRLRQSGGIIPSKRHPQQMGRIDTRTQTGLFPLILEDADGTPVATAAVEVRSRKINYRTDYQHMLNDIGAKCSDLLLDMRTPMQTRMQPTMGEDPETIQHQFAFLRSILDSREFQEALQRLIAMPHRRLQAEETERDIRRGVRPSHQTLRQIASRNPRLPVPPSHPVAARMMGLGIAHPSVPAMVTMTQQRDTVDTPENRFVKHALTVYVDFLARMERALHATNQTTYKRLTTEVTRLREGLAETLSRDFFRDISAPTVLPLGSPVLQRKAGYREMLQAWLKFQLAASLSWEGGEDVFGAGKRDMAVLYEYWLFFQLLDVLQEQFALPHLSEQVFHRDENRLGLRLKRGSQLEIRGTYAHDTCPLEMRFSYNRTFAYTADPDRMGSWTRNMQPDYTLSMWPAAGEGAEGEARSVHLHFDAKYRADQIEEVFGADQDGPEDLQAERQAERAGTYKRADLLKMHAYRDAILHTKGAYVLYPGTVDVTWSLEQGAVLPSIGALAIRPGADGEVQGRQSLSDFLSAVVEHLVQTRCT